MGNLEISIHWEMLKLLVSVEVEIILSVLTIKSMHGDPDEVDLQKRAMAKKIYQLLIADNQIRGDDPSTENVVEENF